MAGVGIGAALAPLRGRDFRLLFVGRTVSRIGGSFSALALAFAVQDYGGDATDIGLVLAAFMASNFGFLLVGGVWSDRIPRHWVMVGSNVLNALVQGAAAIVILTGVAATWQLMALAALNGVAQAFFHPASMGIVPQVVDEAHLQEANALLRMSMNATAIAGSAAAGVMVELVGAGWAVALDAATFALAAVCLALIRLPRLPLETQNMRRELAEGWYEFSSRSWLVAVVLAFGLINAFWVGGLNVLGPVVAKRELGGADAWGIVLSAMGLGLLAGAAVALRWRPTRALRAGVVLSGATALPLAGLATGLPVWALVGTAFLSGLGIEIFSVYWDLSLQQHVPREALSRVAAYDGLGSIGLLPIGLVAVGPLSESIGMTPTLWICAVGTVALTVAMLAVPSVWRLERADEIALMPADAVR